MLLGEDLRRAVVAQGGDECKTPSRESGGNESSKTSGTSSAHANSNRSSWALGPPALLWAGVLSQKILVRPSGASLNPIGGSNVKRMVQATTVLSNQEVQSSLSHLARKLARLRASDAPPRAIMSPRRRARRPGWVRDAVVRVLADHGEPMRFTDVHVAVEALLGEPVSLDSVGWVLSSDVRDPAPRFVRVARGLYVLANASHSKAH
jgi:hypothetical protein